jgi:hypothetical protein
MARSSSPGARTAVAERPRPTAVAAPPVAPEPTVTPEPGSRSSRARKKRKGRRRRRLIAAVVIFCVLAAGGGVGYRYLEARGGPPHVVSAPSRLLGYLQQPAMAKNMDAQQLRREIEAKGRGEASHVVDAVYENAKSQIILFIGGNLSGSASSFISSFTGMLPNSFVTRPGSLGGEAACVPGASTRPAECAWADNDTFGLIASPDTSANALASELRQIRPLVEHRAG